MAAISWANRCVLATLATHTRTIVATEMRSRCRYRLDGIVVSVSGFASISSLERVDHASMPVTGLSSLFDITFRLLRGCVDRHQQSWEHHRFLHSCGTRLNHDKRRTDRQDDKNDWQKNFNVRAMVAVARIWSVTKGNVSSAKNLDKFGLLSRLGTTFLPDRRQIST